MEIKQDIAFLTHLFYRDPAIYLLDKLRDFGDHKIRISLLAGGKFNDKILTHANNIFSDVDHLVLKENRGSDQWGLYNLYTRFLDDIETDWIFYTHDKHISKLEWLDECIDPLMENSNLEKHLENLSIGMISSTNWKMTNLSEAEITESVKEMPASRRIAIVRQRHTLCWLRELQFILLQNTGFQDMDNVNPTFTAGNLFFIRNHVISQALQCVLDPSFFEDVYRCDGDVAHALERFYFYVSTSLGYENQFLASEEKVWIEHSKISNKTRTTNEGLEKGHKERMMKQKENYTYSPFKEQGN
jgi:hypothetical protein